MTRLILDTNVFVSGIFWSGPPARILKAWQNGNVSVVYSKEILEEYIRVSSVLEKKYRSVDISPFISLVTLNGELIEAIKLNEAVSCDPDDDKFIAAGLAVNCIIVSGDSDLLEVNGYCGLQIIKPSTFVNQHL